jgi:hypothetical protein
LFVAEHGLQKPMPFTAIRNYGFSLIHVLFDYFGAGLPAFGKERRDSCVCKVVLLLAAR